MYTDNAYIIYDSFCGKFYGKFGNFHRTQQERALWNSWRDIEGRGENCEGRPARATSEQRGRQANNEGEEARSVAGMQRGVPLLPLMRFDAFFA